MSSKSLVAAIAERVEKARSRLRGWLDAQGFELALRLSLLDLLLGPVGDWTIRPAVLILAAIGLLSGDALRSPLLWWLLTVLTGWRVISDWPMSDNHAYLLCYWCLAVAIALRNRAPERTLAASARLLVGLVFGFAVVWKAWLSPDFLDERFFRHLFLTDDRFEGLALTLGGISELALQEVRELLEEGLHEPLMALPSTLETQSLRNLARWATIGSLAIEAAVALAFLLPKRLGIGRWRDGALILFCVGTYAIAPVPGFGWLLIAMGVAQCPSDARTTRWLYLVTFAIVLVHDHARWFGLLPRGA
jgi:hypothetical protein